MELVGRGPFRICYVGADEGRTDSVRRGFDQTAEEIDVVVERVPEEALDLIADAQQRQDPRMRSELVDTETPFDCVIATDGDGIDALSFVETVRAAHEDLPIVMFASDGSETYASRAITAGVTDYVSTDDAAPIDTLVERAVEHADSYRDTRRRTLERERAERIVDEMAEIVTVVEPGASIGYQNEAVADVLGYTPEAIRQGLVFSRIHPDDWQDVREAFYDAVIDPDHVPQVEYRVQDADGEWRTVVSRGRNLLSDPLIGGFVVTTRDVTARKDRERDLESYRTVVETVGEAMYALDREGTFTWVNDAFLERTGYDREFVEGSHVSTFMRDADVEAGTDLIIDLIDDDDRNWGRLEIVFENVEGEIRRYEDSIAVLTDEEGEFRGSVGVIRELPDDS